MVALLFLGLATNTQANTFLDVLVDQKISIENGYRFGKITYLDARALLREQARIEQVILKAKNDGVITVREQAKIRKLQRRADHNIWLASSITNRFNRNSTSFYDRYDPWNPYGTGWNQGYFYQGPDCNPRQPTPTPSQKSVPKKTVRRN